MDKIKKDKLLFFFMGLCVVMGSIKFKDNDFTVEDSRNFNDIGEFRIICYSTGYYAMQKFDEVNLRWVTLYICPFKEDDSLRGYQLIYSLLDYFELSENSLNNELLNLCIQFPNDKYKDIICKDDMRCVVDKFDDMICCCKSEWGKFMEYLLIIFFFSFAVILGFCLYYLL